MDRFWHNFPQRRFDRSCKLCVVTIVRQGLQADIPTVVDGDPMAGVARAVVCEDALAWRMIVEQLENVQHAPQAAPMVPTACMAPTTAGALPATLERLFERVPAQCYLFARGPMQLDAQALDRAADHHRAGMHAVLQIDLASSEAGGARFTFGDYLRYRTYMARQHVDFPPVPPALDNLLLARDPARACAQRLIAIPATAAWQQLVLLEILAEYGIPASSPLLVGYRKRRAAGGAPAWPATDGAPDQDRLHTLSTALAACATRLGALRGVQGDWLRGLFRVHMLALTDHLRRERGADAVAADALDALDTMSAGMLDAVVAAAESNRHRALELGSLLADQLDLGGLHSLECEPVEFEQRLVRLLHSASAAGRFGALGDEIEPLLRALIEIARAASWPIAAPDLSWCYQDAMAHTARDGAGAVAAVHLPAEQFARLEAAVRDHLTREFATLEQMDELEGRLAQARAALAAAYPGRLGTLIISALRGSARDRIALPVRLLRLAWSVLVTERRGPLPG